MHNADIKALVPTLQSLRLAPLLKAVGVLPANATSVKLAPPAAPLPPSGAEVEASADLRLPSAVKLERSKTLMQRDDELDKAARSAQRTLQRHAAVEYMLKEHSRWVEEWVATCQQQLELVVDGTPQEAKETILQARNSAAMAIRELEQIIACFEKENLQVQLRDVADNARELRRQTHLLVKRFGSDVGSWGPTEAKDVMKCWISTAAGFHEKSAPGKVDGGPYNPLGEPAHMLATPRSVTWLRDDIWIFVDSTSHRVRQLDAASGIITTVAGEVSMGHMDGNSLISMLRNPSAVLALPDGRVLVADTGNYCLRMLSFPTDGSPRLVTITSTKKGHKDGDLASAEFCAVYALAWAGQQFENQSTFAGLVNSFLNISPMSRCEMHDHVLFAIIISMSSSLNSSSLQSSLSSSSYSCRQYVFIRVFAAVADPLPPQTPTPTTAAADTDATAVLVVVLIVNTVVVAAFFVVFLRRRCRHRGL